MENRFQDGGHSGQLGFPIEIIFTIFYLQDTPILPIKFRVNGPFGSGEEALNLMVAIMDFQSENFSKF